MKKVLIGVGAGCGVLVLLVIVAVVGFGFWAKGKAEEIGIGGEKFAQQEERVQQLNQKYDFEAPPKGQPLKLEEDRLKDYLAVREQMKPIYAEYEQKAKKFEKQDGEQATVSEGFEALGMMMDLMSDMRAKWLDALESRNMSPKEFHTITASLYTSTWAEAASNMQESSRAAIEQLKTQMEQQANDSNMPAEVRAEAKKTVAQLEGELANMEKDTAGKAGNKELHAHNAALAKKYEAQINDAANPILDGMLLGGDGSDLGSAFDEVGGM